MTSSDLTTNTADSNPDGGHDDGQVHRLSGDALASVLAAIPDDVAARAIAAALSYSPSGSDAQPPDAHWSITVCVNGHWVMYVGHEDPVTLTSVYDGKVVMSATCTG